MKAFFLIIFAMFITSCNKKIKDPHLVDPVYNYYKQMLENNSQEIAKIKTEILKTKDLADKAEPQTGGKQEYLDTYFEQQKKLAKLEENEIYFKNQIKNRELEVRALYNKAFEEKREWPDKKALESFETELSLLKQRGKQWKSREWFYEKRVHDMKKRGELPDNFDAKAPVNSHTAEESPKSEH